MEILFLHPNFPGQFKHLAKALSDEGHTIKFLCQTHYGRRIKGVERITLKDKCGNGYLEELKPSIIERSQILGDQYRRGFITLKDRGLAPQIIFSHSGWGCGLHAKEVWPEADLISYLEWWFDPKSEFFSFDSKNKDLGITAKDIPKNWRRNQQIALELSVSKKIITPTEWQRSQLPDVFRKECEVIFDGIDTNIFCPSRRKSQMQNNFKLTYGTRGLEPMRCFPQFVREIPNLLTKYPEIRIEIAGDDRSYYGNRLPEGFKSRGKWAREYLDKGGFSSQVEFLGTLSFEDYSKWLLSSHCHVYLTHPFIPSWSLFEAYCSGLPIIASNIDAVRQVCRDSDSISYVDHRDKGFLLQGFSQLGLQMKRGLQRPGPERDTERFEVGAALRAWKHVSGLNVTTKV